jgi:hypothetical protein
MVLFSSFIPVIKPNSLSVIVAYYYSPQKTVGFFFKIRFQIENLIPVNKNQYFTA